MNKDKQIDEIERMSHEIDRILIEAEKRAPYPPLHPSMLRAKALYDNGYRKASDVASEILGALEKGILFLKPRKDNDEVISSTYDEVVRVIQRLKNNYGVGEVQYDQR